MDYGPSGADFLGNGTLGDDTHFPWWVTFLDMMALSSRNAGYEGFPAGALALGL